MLTEVSQFLTSLPCIVGVGQSFIAGFAACIANPTLIRFPLYVAGKKTGKLQYVNHPRYKTESIDNFFR